MVRYWTMLSVITLSEFAMGADTPARTTPGSGSAPVQVHLALGYTAVAWASYDATRPLPGSVRWSLSKDLSNATTAQGDVRPFTADAGRVWYTHTANMTGLKPSTRYYYQVLSASAESTSTFSFKTQPDASTIAANLPERHLIFGDMGASDAFSLCSKCSGTSPKCDAETCATATQTAGLISEVGTATHITHCGDYAYNFEDGGGTVGDQFMANIEQVAANIPYMTSIGNHENSAGSLAHYTERFRHVPSNSGTVATENVPGVAPNNWYYSWDAGLVHYVAISTELYFGVSGGPDGTLAAMYEWIEADLTKANNNRANVPWIVVHGHRAIYCSGGHDCDDQATTVRDGLNGTYGMEEMFFKHGVDLYVNGHEHSWERTYPIYKGKFDASYDSPKATIYVVTGAAGCKELHKPWTHPQANFTAFRSNTFGYSRLNVHNHTHLHFEQVQTDPAIFDSGAYGTVIDDMWIVQPTHGPFSAAAAPSGRCPIDGCPSATSYDHWHSFLRLDAGADHTFTATAFEGREKELMSTFQSYSGEGQWMRHQNDVQWEEP